MERENVIKNKSFTFALRIIKLCRYLNEERKEYVLSKQLLRSGTSIGANVVESEAGQSKKDFCAKLAIASKESRETLYWLQLLRESQYITPEQANSMIDDCDELKKILTSIIITLKQNKD